MSNTNQLKGKVAAILNSRELAINIGLNAGVSENMIFNVFGEAILKDPDTDITLGSIRYKKGRVKIVTVEEKFSVARTFDTYEKNIGGPDVIGNYEDMLRMSTSALSILGPPEWVTKVQTLEFDERGIDLPERLNNDVIYLKIGDVVEIDIESISQEDQGPS